MNYKKNFILLICIFLNGMLSSNLFSQNEFNYKTLVYIEGGFLHQKNAKNIFINDFLISKYEITNEEFCSFLNKNTFSKNSLLKFIDLNNKDSKIFIDNNTFFVKKGFEKHPVTFVSWFGAKSFCDFYNLRLPTKSEWEYAAKRKKNIFHKSYIFSGSNNANDVAWYKNNSNKTTHKVGLKLANKKGLFDMSGNVDEWCNDWYNPNNMPNTKKTVYKVIKGGSWYNSEKMLRILNTRATNPKSQKATIGFRVVKDIATFCPVK